ncbi:MAG: hypothetical protein AB7U75_09665 [Hyphomicrobiaceae bacterium]
MVAGAIIGAVLGNVVKYGFGAGELNLGAPEVGTILGISVGLLVHDLGSRVAG